MQRTTVAGLAKLADCSANFVRKVADGGFIETRRDWNGWRVFPDPAGAARTIRELLLGETDDCVEKRRHASSGRN